MKPRSNNRLQTQGLITMTSYEISVYTFVQHIYFSHGQNRELGKYKKARKLYLTNLQYKGTSQKDISTDLIQLSYLP